MRAARVIPSRRSAKREGRLRNPVWRSVGRGSLDFARDDTRGFARDDRAGLGRQRKANREARALPFFAVDADRAVVRFDDRLRDVKAQSEAAVIAARNVARTVEGREKLGGLVPRNAAARE